MLLEAYEQLLQLVRERSDEPIQGGRIEFGSPYFVLAANANNHQITYRVMCNALEAIVHWMTANGDAKMRFEIWDGDDMVGKGLVSRAGG